jgi:hypothetical protein
MKRNTVGIHWNDGCLLKNDSTHQPKHFNDVSFREIFVRIGERDSNGQTFPEEMPSSSLYLVDVVNVKMGIVACDLIDRVNDYCLTPNEQFFSSISCREQVTFNEMMIMSKIQLIYFNRICLFNIIRKLYINTCRV